MVQVSIGTLKAEISRLNRECARLQAQVGELKVQLSEQENDHSTFVNDILHGAPECMDGDAAAEAIALDYVRSLEGEGGGMTGHRADCGCWS